MPETYKGLSMKIHMVSCVLSIGLILAIGLVTISCSSAGEGQSSGPRTEKATFAGGCFWCMEPAFDKLDGVKGVVCGYTGGHKINPSYEQVSAGGTGHAESVEITYDPEKISYARLLDVFWHNIDPTVKDRQFCDVGNQYRSAIFYHDEEQRRLAEESKKALEQSPRFKGTRIYTEIVPSTELYPAETYHQHYYKKNPIRYKFYRYNCGRDERLTEIWGKQRAEPGR
jgi:peptide-methionine (S)-S-oxide reductase